MSLFKLLTQKFVTDHASLFQNFRVAFHKFQPLFSTRLSQLGSAITSLRKMGSENAHSCAQNAENDFGFDFFE
jgi:hypothetical protein